MNPTTQITEAWWTPTNSNKAIIARNVSLTVHNKELPKVDPFSIYKLEGTALNLARKDHQHYVPTATLTIDDIVTAQPMTAPTGITWTPTNLVLDNTSITTNLDTTTGDTTFTEYSYVPSPADSTSFTISGSNPTLSFGNSGSDFYGTASDDLTVTYTIPPEGSVRWDDLLDALMMVADGDWVQVMSGQQVREMSKNFHVAKKLHKRNRFEQILKEMSGSDDKETSKEEKKASQEYPKYCESIFDEALQEAKLLNEGILGQDTT